MTGLDKRFGQSTELPVLVHLVALAVMVLGHLLFIWSGDAISWSNEAGPGDSLKSFPGLEGDPRDARPGVMDKR